MIRVYLADAISEERTALRLMLIDLKMEIVGEGMNWSTTLAEAPGLQTDLLLIDWELLPDSPTEALGILRKSCPAALVIVLISRLDPRHQAALSAGADAFISKTELPERMAARLSDVAAGIRSPE